jgi:branched-chain amino acid transport system ATP-binding protein
VTLLQLRALSGHWYEGRYVGGHTQRRSVSFSLDAGEWVAVLGKNGVGKSTLLSAIAGTVTYATGNVLLDGEPLPPRDVHARFQAGAYFVPQHAYLNSPALSWADAESLTIAHRPAFYNEDAIRDCRATLQKWGLQRTQLSGRIFDLIAGILSVPRLLILDEIVPALPGKLEANGYALLKQLLPGTCVIFTDHDVNRALAAANYCLWLQDDVTPQFFATSDKGAVSKVVNELASEAPVRGADGDVDSLFRALDLSISPREQLRTAVLALGLRGSQARRKEQELVAKFEFLSSRNPAEELSGGERIVLLWVLLEPTGIQTLPTQLIEHLAGTFRAALKEFQDGRKEIRNASGTS